VGARIYNNSYPYYIQSERSTAQFKYTEETGIYIIKEGQGGINWYNYQKKILIAKLLPFVKECLKERPGTIIQENNTPAYTSQYQ
jgi:hypothetical protein